MPQIRESAISLLKFQPPSYDSGLIGLPVFFSIFCFFDILMFLDVCVYVYIYILYGNKDWIELIELNWIEYNARSARGKAAMWECQFLFICTESLMSIAMKSSAMEARKCGCFEDWSNKPIIYQKTLQLDSIWCHKPSLQTKHCFITHLITRPYNSTLSFPLHFSSLQWGNYLNIHYFITIPNVHYCRF